jgi:FKBP-type peptidyl-prolyl cis-trans isomerase (trigger factor)
MKVSVKKINALRREMLFEVPKERVQQKTDEVLSVMLKHAKLPGFRPGKAPKAMVQKAHGKAAHDEMLKKLIPEVYQQGLVSEQIDPIDLPAIDQVELVDGALKFRAQVDLRPSVEVKNYKGIKVTKKTAEVTDEELAKTLEMFKKGRGLDEKAELDDAFAKSLGFPGMEDLKKALRRNLESDKERQNKLEVEEQVVQELVKNSVLDIPQSLVDRQFHGRLEDFYKRLKHHGMKDEDIQKRLEESKDNVREAAEKDVRLFLILQKIAQTENLVSEADDNIAAAAMKFLLQSAQWEDAK